MFNSCIDLQIRHSIHCQAWDYFIDFNGRIAMAAASNLLLLRTIALWGCNRSIIYPMAILSLGQWAIFIYNILILKESWDPILKTCIISTGSLDNTMYKVQFIYSKGASHWSGAYLTTLLFSYVV